MERKQFREKNRETHTHIFLKFKFMQDGNKMQKISELIIKGRDGEKAS